MAEQRSEIKSERPFGGGKRVGAIALIAVVAAASFYLGQRAGHAPSPTGPGPAPARSGGESASSQASVGERAARPQAGTAVPLPADSVAGILALPTDFSETYAAYALAAQADEALLLALIEEAKRVERDSDRLALISIFIGRYGEIDPVSALDYIVASDLEAKPNLVYRLVNSWSKVDLDAAIEALRDLDDPSRLAAADAILSAYSDADAAALADLRARLAEPAVAAGPSPPAVLRLATSDPESALAEATRLGGQDRMVAVFAVGGIWAQTDPRAALARSRTIEDPALRDALQRGIFVVWTDRDPAAALELLEPGSSDTERAAILNGGLVRLAQRDPRLAFSQVAAVEDAGLRNAALQRVFRTWAQQDPFAASAALDEVAAGDIASLGELVGREFALRAPAEALDWALGRDDAYGTTYRAVLIEVAKADPQIALDSAAALTEPVLRSGIFGLIFTTVADRDPVAAAGYWQQVPAEARAEAAMALAARWQMRDPDAAADWLLGLPPGADRDAGLGGFVAAAPNEASDVPRLLNAITIPESRDRSALRRIRSLIQAGQVGEAESELAEIELSADAYRQARTVIDASR